MKLYHSFGSCSTSCHITLEESGLKYEAIEVDWDNPKDSNVELVSKLNPLGTLPVFITDQGKQLDQNIAIQVYIADLVPEKKLLPPVGTIERAEAMNWLSWVASDFHKAIGGMFSIGAISSDSAVQEIIRKHMLNKANEQLRYLESKLEGRKYLMGDQFITADAYAFVVIGWTKWLNIPITSYKNIQDYIERIRARPAVASVLKTGEE